MKRDEFNQLLYLTLAQILYNHFLVHCGLQLFSKKTFSQVDTKGNASVNIFWLK